MRVSDITNKLLDWGAIVYKNYRTTLVGVVVCAFTTWRYLEGDISWSEAVIGWGFAGGLLLAKDGQTQTEYDREHKCDFRCNERDESFK